MKPTRTQRKVIRRYWEKLQTLSHKYYAEVHTLEIEMERDTGIDGIEFFQGECEGYVGIGTVDREMELIQF